jgi:ABC-type phosphate transport system substrate-binding protein
MLEEIPLPDSIPLSVQISPDVNPDYQQVLAGCVKEHPYVALLINDGSSPDITLQLGEPDKKFSGFSALLGWEKVVFVANQENDISNLEQKEWIGIFTQSPPELSVWSYPENSTLRLLFEEIILNGNDITPYASLVPDPESMLEAIRQDKKSIGYLPESWVTEDLTVIELDYATQKELQLPVLGVTESEPEGVVNAILVCMQDRGD